MMKVIIYPMVLNSTPNFVFYIFIMGRAPEVTINVSTAATDFDQFERIRIGIGALAYWVGGFFSFFFFNSLIHWGGYT